MNTAKDRQINMQVARQHPHMKPVTEKPTSECFYDGTPAVAVRTGRLGNRFGLCTDCKACHDKQQIAAPYIATMENFRSSMRAAGLASAAVERFADHMVLLLSFSDDPQRCMDIALAALGGADEEQLQAVGATS